jgi:hypothetical protein
LMSMGRSKQRPYSAFGAANSFAGRKVYFSREKFARANFSDVCPR